MPLYTFVCAEGHPQEVLCKHSEKDTLVEVCKECGEGTRPTGAPELIQPRDFSKPKYSMQAIMSDGSKQRVDNVRTDKKRSDM
jgi:rRNA maturation protein Nop10